MNILKTVKDELINDPKGMGYAGMTDQQAFDAMSAKNIPAKQSISIRYIKSYLTLVGKYFTISESTLSSAKEAIFNLKEFEPAFDMTVAGAETILTNMLDTLVADGLIDANDKAYILSLGDKLISRADELKISNLGLGHIIDARKL